MTINELENLSMNELKYLVKTATTELNRRYAEKEKDWEECWTAMSKYVAKYGQIPCVDSSTGEVLCTIDRGSSSWNTQGAICIDREEGD